MQISRFHHVFTLKITKCRYKNRGIALYVISTLLLSVLVYSLNNNASTSIAAYGDNANDVNNSGNNNNNEANNRLLINNISGQIADSNTNTDREQVQLVF